MSYPEGPADRASVVATNLIATIVRRLRAPQLHAELAALLRDEVHEIKLQLLDEIRTCDPWE